MGVFANIKLCRRIEQAWERCNYGASREDIASAVKRGFLEVDDSPAAALCKEYEDDVMYKFTPRGIFLKSIPVPTPKAPD